MSILKKAILKIGIIIGLMASAVFTWEAVKHFCFSDNNLSAQIHNSNINQKVIEEYLHDKEITATERFMENIDTTQEIILVEETGISNITLKKGDNNGFWSLLAESEVTIAVEYKATISINPSNIKFINSKDHVVASYSTNDFHINSVEILNENIIVNRKIFGLDFSDDTKIMMKKVLISDVKKQIMNDKNIISQSKSSLESFYNDMAKKFGTRINFISEGGPYAINDMNYDSINDYDQYKETDAEIYVPTSMSYNYNQSDGVQSYTYYSDDIISVGAVCRDHGGNTSPYIEVSQNQWNSHFTQTHYSVVEEGGEIVGAGVKWNDPYVRVIDNEMNYRDPQYGYLPIYAVNINQVKEYGRVYGSDIYGSIIEIEYPDGTVRRGIILDACGQCAKESKIDLWVYHDDNSKHINDVQFKFTRFGWGNTYNEEIFKNRMINKTYKN